MASPVRVVSFPAGGLAVAVGMCLGTIELLPDAASLAFVAAVVLIARAGAAAGSAMTPRLRILTVVTITFFAVALASSVAAGSLREGIHIVARFAIFPAVAMAMGRASSADVVVSTWRGATLGASAAGVVSLVEVVVTDVARPAGLANPILFGGLAVILGALSVVLAPLVVDQIPQAPRWSAVAAGLGVGASLLAQARGSWVALGVVAAIAAVAHVRRGGSLRPVVVATVALVVIVPVGLGLNGSRGFAALDRAVDETAAYVFGERDDEVRSSSVGARFEMWGSAMSAFDDRPLLGVGWGGLEARFVLDSLAGLRPDRLAEFEHAHNQFVGALASGGLVGFAALLALLGVPGRIFSRAARDPGPAGVVGTAGLVVVAGFAAMALTEAVFERSSPVVFYAVAVSVLLGQLDRLTLPVESEQMFV